MAQKINEYQKREKPHYAPECLIDGCTYEGIKSGYCEAHKQRIWLGADANAPIKRRGRGRRLCAIAGCSNFVESKGLCGTHVKRLKAGSRLDAPIRKHHRPGRIEN